MEKQMLFSSEVCKGWIQNNLK